MPRSGLDNVLRWLVESDRRRPRRCAKIAIRGHDHTIHLQRLQGNQQRSRSTKWRICRQRLENDGLLEDRQEKSKVVQPIHDQPSPRDKNTQADALANLGSALRKSPFSNISLLHLQKLSVDTSHIPDVMTIDATPKWTTPIIRYLKDDVLPDNPLEARKRSYKASRYTILHDVLFKVSSTGLLQRCLEGNERQEVLQEHHNGKCGNHSGELSADLDTSEELREAAYIRMAAQQHCRTELQQERQSQSIQNRRLGVEKSLPKHQRFERRQVRPNMGRTIPDPRRRR
uniref:Uncharacterized protein n=1 Tax=Chenopodium quinoa TaxID=63459 RepID=A0A803MYI7_CHEQI